MKSIEIFASIWLFILPGNVYSLVGEKTIRKKILTDYDRWVRPVESYENVTVITYGASIHQIVDFDAKAETLSTLMWQRMCWNDSYMNWDPDQHGGLQVVRFNQNEIWVPDILPYNEIGSFDADKFKNIVPLRGYPNGKVCWNFPTIMETICKMDVTDFPSDEQSCQIMVGSWQYSKTELTVVCDIDHLDESNFSEHSQWLLIESTCEEYSDHYTDGNYSSVRMRIRLQRLKDFYVQNLILPNGVLLALSSLIFFLPSRLAERIGFGITVTLALCVNLVIVIDFIPETSKTIPALCTYFFVSICLSGGSLLLATVSLNIHSSSFHDASCKQQIDLCGKVINKMGTKIRGYKSWTVNSHRTPAQNMDNKLPVVSPEQANGEFCPVSWFDIIAGIIYVIATTLYTVSFIFEFHF